MSLPSIYYMNGHQMLEVYQQVFYSLAPFLPLVLIANLVRIYCHLGDFILFLLYWVRQLYLWVVLQVQYLHQVVTKVENLCQHPLHYLPEVLLVLFRVWNWTLFLPPIQQHLRKIAFQNHLLKLYIAVLIFHYQDVHSQKKMTQTNVELLPLDLLSLRLLSHG